jgi:hypothetical protein
MNLNLLDISDVGKELSDGYYSVRYKDIKVPIAYRRGSENSMLLDFHGAINRDRFNIPKFQAYKTGLGGAYQLRIADSTLELGDRLRMGWYIGGEKMPFQLQLAELLQIFFDKLNINRRIYFGGSAGGFAALYFSFLDNGSACVVVNPQVNLHKYSRRAVGDFIRTAWPSASSLSDIEDRVVVDLPKLYQNGFSNHVVYLQSVGDTRHFEQQLPLFCRVGFRNPSNFILQCSYWGVPAHGNSVPHHAWDPWLQSLLSASSLDRQELLDTYYFLSNKVNPIEGGKNLPSGNGMLVGEDFQLADLLRNYHLRHPQES